MQASRWVLFIFLAYFWPTSFGYLYKSQAVEILVENGSKLAQPYKHFLYKNIPGTEKLKPPLFRKHPSVAHLDCPRILSNDTEYIGNLSRIGYKDPWNLDTSCTAIKSRNYFPMEPNTKEEENFPIAYVRVVYKDYHYLEMELAAEYAPQNIYVYVLDRKSPMEFHERVRGLATCFKNVFVLTKTFDMDSKNMNYALVEGLKFLNRQRFNWKYVIFLQNHDVIIRTNSEIVEILKFFNGTNDIEVNPPWPWLSERIDLNKDWTFKGLNFFKNASRNIDKKIDFSKGYAVGSLSRHMVEFMLNELNLTTFLAQLENENYGIDEQLLPTIQADDHIKIPGGFTHKCVDVGYRTDCVTRAAFWDFDQECISGISRHSVCIMGVEDLPFLLKLPYLTINKFMPSIDFGALSCWYEHLFNRTYYEPPKPHKLNMSYYGDLNHVRFNRERSSKPDFDVDDFECRKDPFLNYKRSYQYLSYYRYHYFS